MPSGMEEIESEHASRNPMSSKMRAYQMDIIREEIFGVVFKWGLLERFEIP